MCWVSFYIYSMCPAINQVYPVFGETDGFRSFITEIWATVCRSFLFLWPSTVNQDHPQMHTIPTEVTRTNSSISDAFGRSIRCPKIFHPEQLAIWCPWLNFPLDLVMRADYHPYRSLSRDVFHSRPNRTYPVMDFLWGFQMIYGRLLIWWRKLPFSIIRELQPISEDIFDRQTEFRYERSFSQDWTRQTWIFEMSHKRQTFVHGCSGAFPLASCSALWYPGDENLDPSRPEKR
jgi:hypothetical protein